MASNGSCRSHDVMWQPSSEDKTKMGQFRIRVNQRYGLNLTSYDDLYQWSVKNYCEFWKECWEFVDIKCSKSYDQVVDVTKGVDDVPTWFEGALLNFAENLLRYDDDRVAIYTAGERRDVEQLTFKQLRTNVTKYAAAMKKMGIKKGDRVVGYISNCPAAVEAMLAAASIGAVWSSTSPDFGVTVCVNDMGLSEIFNHPLYIMYSSGTTGEPKCMVHSAGGTLIQHLKEHILHGNTTRDDTMLYYTTTGWMMWNWLVSCLAVGASIVLYDGSPLLPTANVLWDLVDQIGISIFGTGAKWLSVLRDKEVHPAETHSLRTLHTILSTGSPLNPVCYDYVYEHVKKNLLLGSITGGTDIISCFAGQNWAVPVIRGQVQSRNLGMAIESWSDSGEPLLDCSGELVCTKPFPSQPTHFWNDEDCIKYKKAYFIKFPGVWAHGDFCTIDSISGGIIMQGRSDGTLNPNGVRFGSSDIYSVIEPMIEIDDSLCVPQYNRHQEERVILFLKMAKNCQFNDLIVKAVKSKIRQELSARHIPAIILQTEDIPYTLSGKKVEVAVKKIIAGEIVESRGAFRNPESLDLYENLIELQGF
ncbi:acetoacetyl-CoA synthetase-like [Anneissia japonica]|uniref:acetoacetyl-CoA synthetase-like n=1 Tax=Anneissia japonica TaxID=1529436 RepID=UPI0014257EC4|nr:acetoacetyl-CoA synthetase-like [Anneissia japonica]